MSAAARRNNMRGIVFAGGCGAQLSPVTLAVARQLTPIYDKPMIYYPLSVLLLAGIQDILIISTPQNTPRFQLLLGDGNQWGVNISYAVQPATAGLAQAFIIGAEFIGAHNVALVLGDNIFHGHRLSASLQQAAALKKGAQVFAGRVDNPQRYSVVVFDNDGKACELEEKPAKPKSRYAITGLYCYDNTVAERARRLTPTPTGELGITDLNRSYLNDGSLDVEVLGRGMVWLEASADAAVLDAAKFVEIIQKRQGMKVCCPEEICWRQGYIDAQQLQNLAVAFGNHEYGQYLAGLLQLRP